MKKLMFLLFLVSCNTKTNHPLEHSKPVICIDKIWFHNTTKSLTIPLVKVKINVEDSVLLKKIETMELRNVILFSLNKKERESFRLDDFKPFEKEGTKMTFNIWAGFFIDVPFRKHKWTPQEIKKKIEGDIGLVFDKDTIRVKMCQK